MHDWMIGVGFIALLMTPCFIAMRTGVERCDEQQEGNGDSSLLHPTLVRSAMDGAPELLGSGQATDLARRLKLL
jgi:hypothetical protein